MTENRKIYTEEYRKDTADYVIDSGKSVPKAAAELGVNPKTLGRWVRERRDEREGKQAVEADDGAEGRKMQRRIRELEMENEFLKKAAAFFAREQL